MGHSRRQFIQRMALLPLPLLTTPSWVRTVSEWTDQLNRAFGAAKQRILKPLGLQEPIHILPYRGYGTATELHFMGRVLQDEGIQPGSEDTSLWKNLLNMYRRFESDEIPGAQLRLTFNQQTQAFETDEEGYFTVTVHPDQPLQGDDLWYCADIELLAPLHQQDTVRATAGAEVPGSHAQFGIISDIDDTIVRTDASDLWNMIRIAYLGNARTRVPFPGSSTLYRALQSGHQGSEGNPIFYVSSSPWNMYDLLARFMDIHELPAGPLLLRDIELSLHNFMSFSHSEHKREQIDPILQQYANLPFILVGDSGQKDPEIYAQIVRDYPGRILGIYIRNVSQEKPDRQRTLEAIAQSVQQQGSQLVIVPDTVAASQHAAQQGWIRPERVADVRARVEANAA